jgi:hypothetical protein
MGSAASWTTSTVAAPPAAMLRVAMLRAQMLGALTAAFRGLVARRVSRARRARSLVQAASRAWRAAAVLLARVSREQVLAAAAVALSAAEVLLALARVTWSS